MVTGRPYAESELSCFRAQDSYMTSHVVGVAVIIWSPNSLGNWRIPSRAAICTLLPFVPPPPNPPHNDLAEYSLLAASHRIRSLEVPHTLISKVIIIIFQPGAIARILVSLSPASATLLPTTLRVPPMLPLRLQLQLPSFASYGTPYRGFSLLPL